MSIKVIIPQVGQSIAEATIVKWFRKPGERIEKGETLLEIGTDKINTEIPAPESGILEEILVAEGETVPVLTEIAILSGGSSTPQSQTAESETAPEAAAAIASAGSKVESAERRYTPAVRKLVQEHHIDVNLLSGTGAGGRITAEDVLRHVESLKSTQSPVSPPIEDRRVPMTRIRKLIAEHMSLSRRTAADVSTFFEIDFSAVVQERDRAKEEYRLRHNLKLTYLPFVVAAVVKGLQAYPILNASIEGDEIVYKKHINIGIAVAIESGLVVPVLKDAGEKDLIAITRAMQDLSERARTNKLLPDELQGGTFSITNPGVFGALMGTPIIHQPQVAILGVGAVVKRAVVINDAIAIRPMCYFSLSYDHRALDGATADQFLAYIKNVLENECLPAL
jgi:2-oxoglutarate dehydrogenase E2 component (dihydrolipoamide succinyltransferase)/2-oxoisovalerate dehydrogenase E2 component (dihydrolipoyl transacylase)